VAVDRALAVLLTVGGQLAVWLAGEPLSHRLPEALVAAAVTAPVAVRRRHPTAVGIGVPLLSAAQFALWDSAFVGFPVANFLAMYALAVWTTWKHFAVGLVVLGLGGLVAGTAAGTDPNLTVPYVAVTSLVMLLVRRIVGDRDRRALLAERERDVAAREAVLQERTRIARELHDVIAHNVSMMVVQAGAERRVLDVHGGTTRDVLVGIERTGRSALAEMRRLVGMLREDGSDPLTPQPGLNDLPTLVSQVREAGLRVDLQVEGQPSGVPAGVQLSAYRIVQEALTNALKHAGDATATVRVRYEADSLEIEVADDGAGTPAAASGGGHGLAGMRERVALYGGRFSAGQRPDGGFAVRVLLPVR
jgi:signal transduction histidine kinase